MVQLILKNKVGSIVGLCNNLKEIAELLNDNNILNCKSITQLTMYLLENYFHCEINGVKYWLEGSSFGSSNYSYFTFRQLPENLNKEEIDS